MLLGVARTPGSGHSALPDARADAPEALRLRPAPEISSRFGEASVVGPFVNLVAIPLFNLVLVPLTVLATLALSFDAVTA